VLSRDARHICITEPRCGLGHFVKHALKVEGSTTYQVKNLCCGSLLFQGVIALAGELRKRSFLIDSR
jgi:hypothetical protein